MCTPFINHSTVTSFELSFRQPPVLILCISKSILHAPLDSKVDPRASEASSDIAMDPKYRWLLVLVLLIATLVIGALLDAMPSGHSRGSNYVGAYGGSHAATDAGNNTYFQGTQASSTLQNTSNSDIGGLYFNNDPPGDGDSDDEDTNNPGDGFALSQHQKSTKVRRPKRMYCPFYLRDPQKHRNCSEFQFKEWKDLREHLLLRKHRRLVVCDKCKLVFKSDLKQAHAAWEKHTQDDTCQPARGRSVPQPSGFHLTVHQDAEIRKLGQRGKRAIPMLKSWQQLWKILFGAHPCPVSPYITDKPIAPDCAPSAAVSSDASFQQEILKLPAMATVPEQDRLELAHEVIRCYTARLQQQTEPQRQSSTGAIPTVDIPAPNTMSLHQSEPYPSGNPSMSSAVANSSTQPTDLSNMQFPVHPAIPAPSSADIPSAAMDFDQAGALPAPQWPFAGDDNDPGLFLGPEFDDMDWWNDMSVQMNFVGDDDSVV